MMPKMMPPSIQRIGWFTASCVLVSNIIGGGIFTTTGILARDLGDPSIIVGLWLLGGLCALGGAMVYGELGSRLPQAGGDYVYLREAYGPLLAFLSGWTSFTIGFGAAVAASAMSFASYALRLMPLSSDEGWLAKGLALLILWLATWFHCRGLHSGGRLQLLLTTTKIIAITSLILGGLVTLAGRETSFLTAQTPTTPAAGRLAVALVIITYCYLGWNVAGFIASEVDNPQRTIPRVMVGGTALVATLYLLLNIVYLSALSIPELAADPIVPVAEKAAAALWGPTSGQVIAAILCLSIAGAVSAMTWAGPRVYWAMAQDSVISPWLAQIHPGTGVPIRAIVSQSLWASLLIISGTFEQILVYSGLVLSLFLAITLSAVFRLRHRHPTTDDHYRVPFYPVLPAVLVASATALVIASVYERPVESLYGLATILSGIPLYLFWRRPSKIRTHKG